jgi:hypothetical protein
LRAGTAALLAALLVSGCTHTKAPEAPPPSPSATTPSATDAVELVVLKVRDLPPGSRVTLIDGGDEIEGQVTLDECGFRFTSEGMRVARRQVEVAYPGAGAASYSNEVVAYDSTAHAELALKEWRTAVQSCPGDEFEPSAVDGVPDVRTQLLEFHTLGSLPVANNTVARQLVTARTGRSLFLSVVYQQHGRLLDAHYLITPAEPEEPQIARLTGQARLTGERLASLPGGSSA